MKIWAKSSYGRGAGYTYNAICPPSRPDLNGGLCYVACKKGYHNFGCCICRPNSFSCTDYGYQGALDISCAKKIHIGTAGLGQCNDGDEMSGLLCYPKCRDGYYGCGPVCWKRTPPGWTNCGMSAAKDTKTCVTGIINQVVAPLTVVLNLVTAGAFSKVETAIKGAEEVEKVSTLKKITDSLTKAAEYKNSKVGQARQGK